MTSVLIGVRTVSKLDDSSDALAGPSLSEEDLEEIEVALYAGRGRLASRD